MYIFDDFSFFPDAIPPTQSNLRREPTPFPKEMRAMAKRVQNLRNKKSSTGDGIPADDLQKKKRRASIEISQENETTTEIEPPPKSVSHATRLLDTDQDILCQLPMKLHMHLVEVSLSSLYQVVVRHTKIINISQRLLRRPTFIGVIF